MHFSIHSGDSENSFAPGASTVFIDFIPGQYKKLSYFRNFAYYCATKRIRERTQNWKLYLSLHVTFSTYSFSTLLSFLFIYSRFRLNELINRQGAASTTIITVNPLQSEFLFLTFFSSLICENLFIILGDNILQFVLISIFPYLTNATIYVYSNVFMLSRSLKCG